MKNQKPRYPDFLCIGAHKAGTTWLFANLCDHPRVCSLPIKELHYFTFRGRGPWTLRREPVWQNIFWNRFIGEFFERHWLRSWWLARFLFLRRTDAWYASLFRRCGDRLAGDFSPAYSTLDAADAARVAERMPTVKIILLLRDPVDRAWSHARMDLAKGSWPFIGMRGTAIGDVPFELLRQHFDSSFSLLRGDYSRMLSIWGPLFLSDQMFIGFSEEIAADPSGFLDRVSAFLGLDPKDAAGWPRATQRFNALPEMPMPPEVARYLAQEYLPGLRQLETNPLLPDRTYVTAWRRNAEQRLAS